MLRRSHHWVLLQGLHWYTLALMLVRDHVMRPLQTMMPQSYLVWARQLYCWCGGIRREPDSDAFPYGWYCYAHLEQRADQRDGGWGSWWKWILRDPVSSFSFSLREGYEPAVLCSLPGNREVPPHETQIDPLLIVKRTTTSTDATGATDETVYYVRRRCANPVGGGSDTDSDADLVSGSDPAFNSIRLPTPVVWSNVRFLCIEYRHPNMSEAVELTLPAAMMVVGNELLSPTCVLRLLEHTMGKRAYHFDFSYQLSIMDSQVRLFTMQSHQYLVLHKNSYVVNVGPTTSTLPPSS